MNEIISIQGETYGFLIGASGPVISKTITMNIGICGFETLTVKNETILYVFREAMIDGLSPPDFIEPWEVINSWIIFETNNGFEECNNPEF